MGESKGAHEAALSAGAQRLEGREEAQMIGARIDAGLVSSDYYEVAADVMARSG